VALTEQIQLSVKCQSLGNPLWGYPSPFEALVLEQSSPSHVPMQNTSPIPIPLGSCLVPIEEEEDLPQHVAYGHGKVRGPHRGKFCTPSWSSNGLSH